MSSKTDLVLQLTELLKDYRVKLESMGRDPFVALNQDINQCADEETLKRLTDTIREYIRQPK
jgi:hypothetical protein